MVVYYMKELVWGIGKLRLVRAQCGAVGLIWWYHRRTRREGGSKLAVKNSILFRYPIYKGRRSGSRYVWGNFWPNCPVRERNVSDRCLKWMLYSPYSGFCVV